MRLGETRILNLGEFHGRGAIRVVVRHVVDRRAHGIAPHRPSIVGLQQIGCRSHILHPRVEPETSKYKRDTGWRSTGGGTPGTLSSGIKRVPAIGDARDVAEAGRSSIIGRHGKSRSASENYSQTRKSELETAARTHSS